MENLDQAKHNDQNKPYSLFFSHVFFMTSLEPDMSNPILLSVSHPWQEYHPTLLLLLLLWLPVLFFLIKYHFFLSSSKYGYMPRLKLWFPQFLSVDTHIKYSYHMYHTYIPYNHAPKANNFTQVLPSNPRKSWHSRHHIVLSFLGG